MVLGSGDSLKVQKLFVYGALFEGMVHYSKVEKYVTQKNAAYLKGAMFRLPVGFPAYLEEGEDLILGQVLHLEMPELVQHLLDEFHGYSLLKPEKSLFYRCTKEVLLDEGGALSCEVYALNPGQLPREAIPIDKGAWQQDLQRTPSFLDRLSGRQTDYIRKLGKSKGREIVPIDLNLYRELMSLDLIVDKGRRLALTRLGKEVFRYLPSE